MIRNPFITSGYVSAEYFCDCRQESERLVSGVVNGNVQTLVPTRRKGKTRLIELPDLRPLSGVWSQRIIKSVR